jgi:hypothetical protein
MSSEMSVARVLAKLEARAAVHREQQGSWSSTAGARAVLPVSRFRFSPHER